jgi:hypothetical protein
VCGRVWSLKDTIFFKKIHLRLVLGIFALGTA